MDETYYQKEIARISEELMEAQIEIQNLKVESYRVIGELSNKVNFQDLNGELNYILDKLSKEIRDAYGIPVNLDGLMDLL